MQVKFLRYNNITAENTVILDYFNTKSGKVSLFTIFEKNLIPKTILLLLLLFFYIFTDLLKKMYGK